MSRAIDLENISNATYNNADYTYIAYESLTDRMRTQNFKIPF